MPWPNTPLWPWSLEFLNTETLLYVFLPYQNAIFVRSPTKNCVTSRMIEKPRTTYFLTLNKNIETVGLSLRNDRILAFICLNGLKTSRFNVMTQYFHQNIPSA